jgi:hypothetical protein
MVDKQKLDIEPGSMLALTNSNVKSLAAMPINLSAVSYRGDAQVLSGNVKGFTANFSMASAIKHIEPLQRLAVSPYKQDQLTAERLLKSIQVEGGFFGPGLPFENASMGR